jgi:hypothetical protein
MSANSAANSQNAVARGTVPTSRPPMRTSWRGSAASSSSAGPSSARPASAKAIVIGATNGMSVIAWRVISAHCDEVARMSADSAPARRPTSRDTSCHTAQMAMIDRIRLGSRHAHSGRQSCTIWSAGGVPHSRPNTLSDSAISQKCSTGLWKTSARSSGEPGHHRLTQSLRCAICRAISP